MALLSASSLRTSSISDAPPRHFTYFDEVPKPQSRESALVLNNAGDVGIGITLEQGRQGLTHVAALIPGSPADLKGIKCGDAILQIDGESVFGMTLAQVSRRVCGSAGTFVTLKIGARPFDFRKPVSPDQIRTVQVNREGGGVYRLITAAESYPVGFSSSSYTYQTQPSLNNNNNNNSNSNAKLRSGHDVDEARDVFRRFDFDGNGWISLEEYGEIMHILGFRIPAPRLLEYFQSIDTDENGRISEDEFLLWFAKIQTSTSQPSSTFVSSSQATGAQMFDA